MKVEAAIFGQICDQCEKPILNKKGIALVAGEDSKTYCQDCYVSITQSRLKTLIEVCEEKLENLP